jgi:hypothetical protein
MFTLSFKHPLWIGMPFILFFALLLSACQPVDWPAASRSTSTPAGSQEPVSHSITPMPTENPADTQLEYTNQEFGFSLRYPKGYEVQQTFPYNITFMAPQGTPGERWRGWMEVERGLDQNAEWYADQEYQGNAILGPQISSQISSSTRVIGGQQAYILERIPGQELGRHVYIVYKGFLYHLVFVPDDPQTSEAHQQMETLYAAVINSFRFLPERRDVPPVTSTRNMVYQIERACEARSEDDITRLLGDEFTLVFWDPQTPEHYTLVRYDRNQVARLMLDKYLSQAPDLVAQYPTDPSITLGDPDLFAKHFPNATNVTAVETKGWGPEGAGGANLIIARRMDGSLYWGGMYMGQGTSAP